MQLRFAKEEDKPFLSLLWQEAFGDSEETVQLFFNCCFTPENTLLAEIDGEKAAALYLLDAELVTGDRVLSLSYLYAAATLSKFRKRGAMSALLAFAEETAKKRKQDAIYLVPAEQHLWDYYGARGYTNAFSKTVCTAERKKLEALAAENAAETLSSYSAYKAVRETALKELSHLRFSDGILQLSMAFAERFGGKIFSTSSAFAMMESEEDKILHVPEICGAPNAQKALFRAILKESDAETFSLSFPTGQEANFTKKKTVPTGMWNPLSATAKRMNIKNAYLGITLG